MATECEGSLQTSLSLVLLVTASVNPPRVSPMVVIVRVSRSKVCVRFDSTMAR